jgi:cation/acetate symporter
MAAELPSAIVYLAAAGVVAAALAAAGAVAVAFGNILGEDVVFGLTWQPPAAGVRLAVARAGLVIGAAVGGAIAISAPTDPLKLMLWAFALTASAIFPTLVLSIWWKRFNAFGSIAGMLTGFAVTVMAIIAGEAEWIGLDSALAAAIGLPAATFAAVAVTLLTPAPDRHILEFVRDIRVPGGEIIYDRETRLQRRQRR